MGSGGNKNSCAVEFFNSRNSKESSVDLNITTNITTMGVPVAPMDTPMGRSQPLRKSLGKSDLAWFSLKR
jgi:hypothetical protein